MPGAIGHGKKILGIINEFLKKRVSNKWDALLTKKQLLWYLGREKQKVRLEVFIYGVRN